MLDDPNYMPTGNTFKITDISILIVLAIGIVAWISYFQFKQLMVSEGFSDLFLSPTTIDKRKQCEKREEHKNTI